MMTYLIVCPLVLLAGFVDSIAGGGGLISLPAYLLSGLPVHQAIASNKMSSAMGTTVSTYRYWKSGYIELKLAPFCIVFAFLGSFCGSNLALMLSDTVFRWVILFILPLTAYYVLSPSSLKENYAPLMMRDMLIRTGAVSFAVGIYDGFYGPGTGTFLILALTALAHMPLVQANGMTKLINLTTNLTALSVFLINGKVLFPLGIIAGLFNMLGNYIGSSLFKKKGTSSVKPVMIAVLIIFFIKTLSEL